MYQNIVDSRVEDLLAVNIREVTEAAIAKYCTDHTEDRADT